MAHDLYNCMCEDCRNERIWAGVERDATLRWLTSSQADQSVPHSERSAANSADGSEAKKPITSRRRLSISTKREAA